MSYIKNMKDAGVMLGTLDPGNLPRKIKNALELRTNILERMAQTEIEVINDDDDISNILNWIETLPPTWEDDDRTAFPKLIEKISHVDETYWPTIADKLAEYSTAQRTSAQVQRLIKRQAKKREKEEGGDFKMTPARIVDIAAKRVINTVAKDSRNLVFPPNGQPYLYKEGYWSKQPPSVIKRACYYQLKAFLDFNQPGLKPIPSYANDTFAAVAMTRAETSLAGSDASVISALVAGNWTSCPLPVAVHSPTMATVIAPA